MVWMPSFPQSKGQAMTTRWHSLDRYRSEMTEQVSEWYVDSFQTLRQVAEHVRIAKATAEWMKQRGLTAIPRCYDPAEAQRIAWERNAAKSAGGRRALAKRAARMVANGQ